MSLSKRGRNSVSFLKIKTFPADTVTPFPDPFITGPQLTVSRSRKQICVSRHSSWVACFPVDCQPTMPTAHVYLFIFDCNCFLVATCRIFF